MIWSTASSIAFAQMNCSSTISPNIAPGKDGCTAARCWMRSADASLAGRSILGLIPRWWSTRWVWPSATAAPNLVALSMPITEPNSAAGNSSVLWAVMAWSALCAASQRPVTAQPWRASSACCKECFGPSPLRHPRAARHRDRHLDRTHLSPTPTRSGPRPVRTWSVAGGSRTSLKSGRSSMPCPYPCRGCGF